MPVPDFQTFMRPILMSAGVAFLPVFGSWNVGYRA